MRFLRECGVQVWVIGQPCDLLTMCDGRWLPLELKSTKRIRKDQETQNEFLVQTNCPVVRSPLEALTAVRSHLSNPRNSHGDTSR